MSMRHFVESILAKVHVANSRDIFGQRRRCFDLTQKLLTASLKDDEAHLLRTVSCKIQLLAMLEDQQEA